MNAKIGRDEQEETKDDDSKDDNDSVNFFSSVDKLFDGTDEEKIKAYEMLQNNRDKVKESYQKISSKCKLKKFIS